MMGPAEDQEEGRDGTSGGPRRGPEDDWTSGGPEDHGTSGGPRRGPEDDWTSGGPRRGPRDQRRTKKKTGG